MANRYWNGYGTRRGRTERTMDEIYRGVRVSCHAGYRAEEEPRWFAVAGLRIDVAEIEDRWSSPGHRYFRVRGNDEGLYLLRHDTLSGDWRLQVLSYGIDPELSRLDD